MLRSHTSVESGDSNSLTAGAWLGAANGTKRVFVGLRDDSSTP